MPSQVSLTRTVTLFLMHWMGRRTKQSPTDQKIERAILITAMSQLRFSLFFSVFALKLWPPDLDMIRQAQNPKRWGFCQLSRRFFALPSLATRYFKTQSFPRQLNCLTAWHLRKVWTFSSSLWILLEISVLHIHPQRMMRKTEITLTRTLNNFLN